MEQMTTADLNTELERLLKAPGENEILEFKRAANDFSFDKLGQYFSALSNEANLSRVSHAWLVLGIEPTKHEVVGTLFKNSWPKLQKLKKDLADKLTERISFLGIHEVQKDGKRVLMFQIPPAPQGIPVSYDGHAYGRDGESKVPLNPEKRERIRAQRIQEDWSAAVVPDATILDLDPEALDKAVAEFRKKFPKRAEEMDRENWGTTTFLNKAKLTIKGQITRAAIILLGKEESEHFLSPTEIKIRWKLKDAVGDDVDHLVVCCPLILSVDLIFNKIRHLKYRYLREPGSLFPEEVDKYEPYTIREAINNAIAHQDYTLSGRINVIELPDQLVFTNKGAFIPGTVERAVIDDAPEEVYRNRFLATAMFNVNMVETAGGGIRKLFKLQSERLFPMPDYDLSDQRVEARITGKVLDMEFAQILARNKNLSLVEIIMLDKVQKRQPLSKQEACLLKERKLIEGRRPNYYFSIDVAKKLSRKAEYTRNRGLDKDFYSEFLVIGLKQHHILDRKEINELLLGKLPESLTAKQRIDKVTNLLTELRKKNIIRNKGTRSNPQWVLVTEH